MSRLNLVLLLIAATGAAGAAQPDSRFDHEQSEPIFMALPKGDPELAKAVQDAQNSLDVFRLLIAKAKETNDLPIVKSRFENAQGDVIWLWLSVQSVKSDGFEATTFEAPPEFPELAKGAKRFIPTARVADWAVSIGDTMYGGYSLRLQRRRLPEAERASYDKYIGAANGWAPLPRSR
jgi:uncharacterized protein YegJ (DUF2314 family)